MRTSDDGILRIKQREGVKYQMYYDSAGLPTIGVGHRLTVSELTSGKVRLAGVGVDWHEGITEEQATTLLRRDLDAAEVAVSMGVGVSLTQTQYDTLVSFTFNVGVEAFRDSTLLRLLNTGDYASVVAQLRRWIYAAKKPVLISRRESEVEQWRGVAA